MSNKRCELCNSVNITNAKSTIGLPCRESFVCGCCGEMWQERNNQVKLLVRGRV